MNKINQRQSGNEKSAALLPEFEKLLSDTHIMLTAAKSGDWEQVITKETERRSNIEAFFSTVQPQGASEQLHLSIEKLIAMDKEITELCLAAKGEIAKAMQDLNTGRQVVSAYQKNIVS